MHTVKISDLFAFVSEVNHCADNSDNYHENNNNDDYDLNRNLSLTARVCSGRLSRYHLLLLTLGKHRSCLDDRSRNNSHSLRTSFLSENVIRSGRIST